MNDDEAPSGDLLGGVVPPPPAPPDNPYPGPAAAPGEVDGPVPAATAKPVPLTSSVPASPQAPAAEEVGRLIDDERLRAVANLRAAGLGRIPAGIPSDPVGRADRVLELSKRTGYPAPLIDRNLDEVEARWEADNNFSIVRRSSSLLRFFAKDPANARVARDDIPALGTLDRWFRQFTDFADKRPLDVIVATGVGSPLTVLALPMTLPGLARDGSNAFLRWYFEATAKIASVRGDALARELGPLGEAREKAAHDEQLTPYEQDLLRRLKTSDAGPAALARAAKQTTDARRAAAAVPMNDALRELRSADSLQDAARAFASDPLGIGFALTLESLPEMVPAGIATVLGGPMAGAATMGLTTFFSAYMGSIVDSMRRFGVDVDDPKALEAGLQDRKLMQRVYLQSSIRGIIAGGLTALGMGFVGVSPIAEKWIANAFLREAANLSAQAVVQSGIAMGSVAGNALAAGDEIRPGDLLAAGIAGAAMTPMMRAGAKGNAPGRGAEPVEAPPARTGSASDTVPGADQIAPNHPEIAPPSTIAAPAIGRSPGADSTGDAAAGPRTVAPAAQSPATDVPTPLARLPADEAPPSVPVGRPGEPGSTQVRDTTEPTASASEGLPSNPAARRGDTVSGQGRNTTEPRALASEATQRRANGDKEARPGNEALPMAARPAEAQPPGRDAVEIPNAANANASRGTIVPPATRGVTERTDSSSAPRSGEPQPGASHAASPHEVSAPREAASVDAIRADIARSPKSAAEIEAQYRAVAHAGAEIEAVLAITREIGGRKWKSNAETTLRQTRPPRAPSKVFIPADKLRAALKKLSPLDAMAVEKSRRYSGGYAEVPFEVYAVRLHPRVGDALGPHVKLSPEGLSLQEVIDAAGGLDRIAGIATDARPGVGSGAETGTSSPPGSVLDTLRANVLQKRPSGSRAVDGPAQSSRPPAQPMRASPRAGAKRPRKHRRAAPDAKLNTAQEKKFNPHGGPRIRNKKLAGKRHPVTNILFDLEGYPIFDEVAVRTVKIKQTGDYRVDNKAADRAAGPTFERPAGYTWHHHQDGATMQLIPTWIHRKTGHTGGVYNLHV